LYPIIHALQIAALKRVPATDMRSRFTFWIHGRMRFMKGSRIALPSSVYRRGYPRRIPAWKGIIVLGLLMGGCSAGDGDPAETPNRPPAGRSGTHSVTLTWTEPTMNIDGTALTDLSGYIVFYGTASRIYAGSLNISGPDITSASVEHLASGRWYFSVKSVSAAGVESFYSGEVYVDL
jgi:hypothetical protein